MGNDDFRIIFFLTHTLYSLVVFWFFFFLAMKSHFQNPLPSHVEKIFLKTPNPHPHKSPSALVIVKRFYQFRLSIIFTVILRILRKFLTGFLENLGTLLIKIIEILGKC